jgi:NAD(P)-dependent dehydrogenase (short-subunit alcohol dehydrogenase family)
MHPIVVTGGASGLGRCTAATLLERGRRVLLVDRDADALRATVDALGLRFGERPEPVVGDLSSLNGIRDVAASVAGPLAGLVNNAGGQLPGAQYPDAPPERWLAALTLNLVAPMLLTQLLWSQLADGGGAVVQVGSSGGIGDAPYDSPEYGAAKAGLRRLTTALGTRQDVRVTAVVPGWIGLDRAVRERGAMSPAAREAAAPLVPPEEVARVIADLLERGRPGEVVELLG